MLLAVRELDEMMGLTDMAADLIVEGRTGKNIQHQIPGLLRQSVYARLVDYEDVNDQEALARDPAMRAVIGKRALDRTLCDLITEPAKHVIILCIRGIILCVVSQVALLWLIHARTAAQTLARELLSAFAVAHP